MSTAHRHDPIPQQVPRTRPRRTDVRAQVLAAATRAFESSGYQATTIADIATAAGFTKGAVYSNFGGKPELFGRVCAERFAHWSLTLINSFEAPDGSDRQGLVDDLTALVTGEVRWPLLLAEFRHIAQVDAELASAYAEIREQQRNDLAEILADRNLLGTTDRTHCQMAANLLLVTVTSLAVERAASSASMPTELVATTLAHIVRSLLP
ncbi:MAG: TetR/AcrR family transcriptional regulator [Propionibacteriaceae bacterium]